MKEMNIYLPFRRLSKSVIRILSAWKDSCCIVVSFQSTFFFQFTGICRFKEEKSIREIL